jgi:hypothetical protein
MERRTLTTNQTSLTVNDEDLVAKFQDIVSGVPRDDSDPIGQSLDEPYRTVCILGFVHTAIKIGGLVTLFDAPLQSTPLTAIPDAYTRIGCQREANIITRAVGLLGVGHLDQDARSAYIHDHWPDVLDTLEPLNKEFSQRDIVEQKLADWIRQHQNDPTAQE